MTRVLKILLVGIFLFLIVVWVSTVFETCSSKKDNVQETENVSSVQNDEDDVDLDEDIFSDEKKAGEAEQDTAGTAQAVDEEPEDLVDYTGEAPAKTTKKATAARPAATHKSQAKSTATGQYLVVAGNFLDKSNAVRMRDRLRKAGYNAEIVNFNLSQYYTVLAGRYQSRSTAEAVVRELKRDGIDSYVHKRKK